MLKKANLKNNHFIFKLGFQREFRCFKKGELFEFKPGLNLIVGDQGCGKSSLFFSIMNWGESGIAMDYDTESNYSFLDTESMNPRVKDSFDHNKHNSVEQYDKALFDHSINRNFVYGEMSHGEVILPLVMSLKEKGKTIFIDEPEAGLSIKSQHKILDYFQNLAKDNQLIIATHSLILIESVKEVLSLEHKKWMTSEEFIESQKLIK